MIRLVVVDQLSTWNVNTEVGNVTVSPLLIVLFVVSAVQIHALPLVSASHQRTLTTVPQLALGVANEITLLFEVVPLVPLEAVVLPALCVPAHADRDAVTVTRP